MTDGAWAALAVAVAAAVAAIRWLWLGDDDPRRHPLEYFAEVRRARAEAKAYGRAYGPRSR